MAADLVFQCFKKRLPPVFAPVIIVFILTLWVNYTSSQNPLCPEVLNKIPDKCSRFKCITSMTKEDCPVGTYFEKNLAFCGCCPACAKYIAPGGACGLSQGPVFENCNEMFCPLLMNECEPGYVCNDLNRCDHPLVIVDPCTTECRYKKSLFQQQLYHWDPECEEDGSYAPKQCKGVKNTYEGHCFCVDKCGQRIFGRQWWAEAENQTCACSRQVFELRDSKHRNIATIHCTEEGNYEPLQCDTDSGTCYCIEPKTGEITGAIVPESEWKFLPCYSVNSTNWEKTGHYLRRCESHMAGLEKAKNEALARGHTISVAAPNCNYDGSFSHLQDDGMTTSCSHKDGIRIENYFMRTNDTMNCKCAIDEVYYRNFSRPFPYAGKCQLQSGNYDTAYNFGGRASCVDNDGFAYGSLVPSLYYCCLTSECQSPELVQECVTNDYKGCYQWFFKLAQL